MPYKFQKLEIYRLALDYISLIYELAEKLPSTEKFNLKSQITRAATSIALNIAEGFYKPKRCRTVQIFGNGFAVIG